MKPRDHGSPAERRWDVGGEMLVKDGRKKRKRRRSKVRKKRGYFAGCSLESVLKNTQIALKDTLLTPHWEILEDMLLLFVCLSFVQAKDTNMDITITYRR